MSNLAVAISIAATKHVNQFDQGGNPYILHPLRLLHKLMQKTEDQDTLILAVLHDCIEDTDLTIDDLIAQGFSQNVINDLQLMTKRKGEDYLKEYIPRIATSYRCILVKMEDLTHNSDIRRLKGLTDKDQARMLKYHTAYMYLKECKRRFVADILSNLTY